MTSRLATSDESLPDLQRFHLNDKHWAEFQAALNAPLAPKLRLQRLLRGPSVFDAPGAYSSALMPMGH